MKKFIEKVKIRFSHPDTIDASAFSNICANSSHALTLRKRLAEIKTQHENTDPYAIRFMGFDKWLFIDDEKKMKFYKEYPDVLKLVRQLTVDQLDNHAATDDTILEQCKISASEVVVLENDVLAPSTNEILGYLATFDKLEQKNRCIRVRFLDWVSEKLQNMSVKAKSMSINIDSPCKLKLPAKEVMSDEISLDMLFKGKNNI